MPQSVKNAKYYSIDQRRLAIMSDWKKYAKDNGINRLEQQQQQRVEELAESLSKTQQVENMPRQQRVEEERTKRLEELNQIHNLERTKRLEEDGRAINLERLDRLQYLERLIGTDRIDLFNKDCIELLNSLPREILENSIVYFDPPYIGTAEYKEGDTSLKEKIVNWAISHKDICPVYVSEYSKYDGLIDCFYTKKAQTLSSYSDTRVIKKDRLLYNGYEKVDETLGDLLGLWS